MTVPPDQVTHRYNRLTPATLFECHCHPDEHDATVFVEVETSFGAEAYPMCKEAVNEFIKKTEGEHGVRLVLKFPVTVYLGHISGVLSNR